MKYMQQGSRTTPQIDLNTRWIFFVWGEAGGALGVPPVGVLLVEPWERGVGVIRVSSPVVDPCT